MWRAGCEWDSNNRVNTFYRGVCVFRRSGAGGM